ncbi:O-antigen ligase family protein [Mucilaginibacter jinjuensis]|uniref:O-antigen ligase family protein n=1 Tax=Mucilaginibacter jinjuensis TaxID=1176721 RepID=A0ABY7TFT0_9SPHI|nr:O-antigen ligase family protein [Mucilaginibacter jinjuensis]WCT14588.1 O-antigen ligase family protein [Mucilaginibacter jinjuensis]
MKKLWLIKDTVTNQVTYFHILLFFACLPLDRFFSELIFVSLVIHTLINLKKADLKRVYEPRVLIVQAVFFVTLFSTTYTTNFKRAVDDWAMQAHILFIPMVFAIHQPLITKYKKQLLSCFAWSCVLVVMGLFAVVLTTIRHFHLPLSFVYTTSFINHNFSKPVGIHATFFSILVVAATVILFQDILAEKKKLFKLVSIVGMGVLFAGLIQLSSKSAIISLVIVAYIFVPLYLFEGRKRFILLGASLAVTLLATIVVLRYDSLKTRLFSDLESDVDMSHITVVTDSRLDRWKATMHTVKAKPIFGFGTGMEKEEMEQTYFYNKLYHSFIHQLNAHNEFLSLLIKSGCIGLAVYLFTLGYSLALSIRNKDLLLTTCVALMISTSIAENALDANKGIFFYSAFFSLLLLSANSVSKSINNAEKIAVKATLAPVSTC